MVLYVAILGFGVVGSGVAEVIEKNFDKITQNASQEIRVKYIVDVRDFPDSPYADKLIKDFSIVENDPEVKVVVETIGGAGVAYDFTVRSLTAGKSVVTSNKELVATFGYELLSLAQEKGVNYMFEASVGGGIPIIRPLSQCLAANSIFEIYGILNGTTNYVLTEMIKKGLSLEEALGDAQKKGYAEANPAADIEGTDACRKICILSSLSFGNHIYPVHVKTEGILGVTLDDVAFSGLIGYKIKLLGRAVCDNGMVAAYVAPHLVSGENMLAGVEGVMNGIVVRGNAIGDVMFYGAGAGKLPTASAVVADVIDSVKHINSRKLISWDNEELSVIADPDSLKSGWYIRTGSPAQSVTKAFPQAELIGTKDGCSAFRLPAMSKYDLMSAAAGTELLSAFRILD